MQLIVVGEGPVDGPGGSRLADLFGVVTLEQLKRRVTFATLQTKWPGRSGSVFDSIAAAHSAFVLTEKHPGATFLVAGKRAGRAFGAPRNAEFLAPMQVDGCTVIIFPHPSKINRWYNSEENLLVARVVLRCFLARTEAREPLNDAV